MFSKTPLVKNSRNQFVNELVAKREKLCNQSFSTADNITDGIKSLRQAKLSLRKLPKRPLEEDPNSLEDKNKRAPTHLNKFFYLPIPKPVIDKEKQRVPPITASSSVPANTSQANSFKKQELFHERTIPGRNLLVINGKVDFCIKMRKLYPEMNVLWNVYGKILKITKGKRANENILILRSLTGGPVLQSFYYDFVNKLNQFCSGSYIRAVGRFVGENRLQTYKLEYLLSESHPNEENFTRIENVTTFALLQASTKKESHNKT